MQKLGKLNQRNGNESVRSTDFFLVFKYIAIFQVRKKNSEHRTNINNNNHQNHTKLIKIIILKLIRL